MTDESIAEIYAMAREAFAGGQRGFQFQSYPFRMTAENLAKHRLDPNIAFWRNLKEGSDHFEVTTTSRHVGVGDRRYVFDAAILGRGGRWPRRAEGRAAGRRTGGQGRAARQAGLCGRWAESGLQRGLGSRAAGDEGSLAVGANARNRLGDVSRPEAWRPDRGRSSSTRTGTRGRGHRPAYPMHRRTP